MSVVPRPAATLVLMREPAAGSGPPEVLLVRRPQSAPFAAGASVFPGGAVEAQDSGQAARTASGEQGQDLARVLTGSGLSGEEALAYAMAALRETFEETLLLLATAESSGTPPRLASEPAWEQARRRMLASEVSFGDWLREGGLRPHLDALHYFAHWITPEGSPIRFDTRFFAAAAPAGQPVSLDANELEGHEWIAATEALRLGGQGNLYLMPPTRVTLERIAPFDSLSAALEGLVRDPVRPVMPRAVVDASGRRTMLFPGDPGYDA